MTDGSVFQRNEKTSVRHRTNQYKRPFIELANFDNSDITPSGNDKCALRNSKPQSSEVLSTTDLISAVGYAWGRARKPLSSLVSTGNSTCKPELIQGDDGLLYCSADGESLLTSNSADGQPCSSNLNSKATFPRLVQENLDNLRLNQKIICHQPSYDFFSFWKIVLARPYRLSNTETPLNLESTYRWMAEIAHAKQKNGFINIESRKRTINSYISELLTNSDSAREPTDTTSSIDSFEGTDLNECTIGCSESTMVSDQNIDKIDCEIIALRCDVVSQNTNLESDSRECENDISGSREGLHEHQNNQEVPTLVEADSPKVEISLSAKQKSPCGLAKQEHAFAGAMAGIFVSLCLHPMDTIKTVIQSCRADPKNLHDIGRSIVAERGITGLYRGISSNILTSAPISAVYTFTYESVKKSLLPVVPKEYQSLAHCMAGGCASIATSFIFTPSERIKQQMQIGSHYRNCWNAFIQVVQKGGVLSLYNGWGAVLCRNVPHSVIKFYTYESLKQVVLPGMPGIESNAQANVSTTLVCGGLAGSMASLFTTPFDVVKTRLQTQIPGSMTPYGGVFNTLTKIGRQEGVQGLYRGLTPRLVMYMIQGALFFASYESFKRLFSLDVSQPMLQHKHKSDDPVMFSPTVSVTA
ncbi:Mitochondrial substrate carrier family protein [Striga hermonthica]|uniref:Mitochondrial substrate carrier family protein n=1 Tax=Striga hermonthica TaxID=68872 RepID=A0A9N7MJQ1_STRHE|nr:Mitochondrial substrate carrier family protein [Striga hermonthica]